MKNDTGNVDLSYAKKILKSSWKNIDYKKNLPLDLENKIKYVISSKLKTYKYILLTSVLAKASNPFVNPVAIQVSSGLEGCFDARSLCHKIIVPWERKYTNAVLGRSNEPFVNNPARYQIVSKSNPCRGEKNQKILDAVVDILESNFLKVAPFEVLQFILHILKQTQEEQTKKLNESARKICKTRMTRRDLIGAIDQIISESFEGQSLLFATLGVLESINLQSEKKQKIRAFSVNQSGSSSKSICDIDVYDSNSIYQYGIEIKDKNFTEYDVDHSVEAISETPFRKIIFLCRNVETQYKGEMSINNLEEKFYQKGIDLAIIDIYDFVKPLVLFENTFTKVDFMKGITEHIKRSNPSREFIYHLLEKLQT